MCLWQVVNHRGGANLGMDVHCDISIGIDLRMHQENNTDWHLKNLNGRTVNSGRFHLIAQRISNEDRGVLIIQNRDGGVREHFRLILLDKQI